MKIMFDFLPIFVFFIVYQYEDLYTATVASMLVSAGQVLWFWLRHRSLDKTQLITFFSIAFLGGLTLFFKNGIFIQLKPTLINCILGLILLFTPLFSQKNLIQRAMESKVDLPDKVWQRLNTAWCVFFFSMGFLNLYVVYSYSMDSWVLFKLFGTLSLTAFFILLQAVYLARYLQSDSEPKKDNPSSISGH